MDTARRDEAWLTQLFGSHSRAVLAYARRRLDSAEDAEDVVVEVFATAWRRRDDVPEQPLPWLYATAGHVIAHTIRARARRTRLGARLAAVRPLHTTESDPGDRVVEATVARDAVADALDDLAESDAELLRLWAWEQLEPAEIAEVLDCTPGTARTRLHRARGRLRAALEQRTDHGEASRLGHREPGGHTTQPPAQPPGRAERSGPPTATPATNTATGSEER